MSASALDVQNSDAEATTTTRPGSHGRRFQ